MRPIALPWGALAALLLLAGMRHASSSRLASAPQDSTLGRIPLRFLVQSVLQFQWGVNQDSSVQDQLKAIQHDMQYDGFWDAANS